MRTERGTLTAIAVFLGFLAGCSTTVSRRPNGVRVAMAGRATDAGAGLLAANLEACPAPSSAGAAPVAADPRARAAAQKGLDFLARDTIAWQTSNNCYGCHVQAVTLEAFLVGRDHDYQVRPEDFAEVMRGMMDLPGGGRRPVGFAVGDDPNHLVESARAFGGAALARYDELLGTGVTPELLRAAEALLEYQEPDGSVRSTDRRPPVVAGPMQSTTQAAQTWRQAHARTADERWLAPIARAEAYLRTRAAQLSDDAPERILELNYAVIGLVAAGAQPAEGVLQHLERQLRAAQNDDGGFSMAMRGTSDAFSTGQAVYALRLVGANDADAAVRRGIGWLIEHQAADGNWSDGGSRRGEALWAVLGLVTTDRVSLSLAGLGDGQHLSGLTTISATASDNGGAGVERIDVSVDDVPVHRSCGSHAELVLDTRALRAGVHHVDVSATNGSGRSSRRRMEVYVGDHYLTAVGTTFEDGATIFSLRNVAPEEMSSSVRLRILRNREVVFTTEQPGVQGPMRFRWAGESAGRYRAALEFARGGRVVQTVEVPFVHDTREAQQAAFAEVTGQLRIDGAAPAANTEVELVDERGQVLERAQTTRSGQYRFRNVDRGRYHVRVRRSGFRDAEAPVSAQPGAASGADLSLQHE